MQSGSALIICSLGLWWSHADKSAKEEATWTSYSRARILGPHPAAAPPRERLPDLDVTTANKRIHNFRVECIDLVIFKIAIHASVINTVAATVPAGFRMQKVVDTNAVSYTHLTLPTICSV